MTHIWVPKLKIVENNSIATPGSNRVSGSFRIIGRLDGGREREIAPWQPNLITNGGLERWGTGSPVGYCSVGTSNQAPSNGDSGLIGYLRTHTSIAASSVGAQASAPYYGWARWTFRFAPPGSDLNLSEVGVGWASGGGSLWSRALIKDAAGAPITVTWLSAETLDVMYEARVYPFLSDVPYSTVLSGKTYTGTIRASCIASGDYQSFCNQPIRVGGLPTSGFWMGTYDANWFNLANRSLATLTENANLASAAAPACTQNAYIANALKRTASYTWSPAIGNVSGGITWLGYTTLVGAVQMSISPAIAKVVDWSLTLNVETPTWGRYAP